MSIRAPAMSLARLSARSPVTLSRQCSRCISSSSSRSSDSILDLLPGARTPTGSHPAQPTPQSQPQSQSQSQPKSRASHMNLARQALTLSKDRSTEIREFARSQDYTKHMYRRWKAGDVYAPHDLSGPEQKKWKFGHTTPQNDAFDVLGINPINEYKNYTMMSEYMTEMGRIKHSKQTGLRPVNQRKIAKAIRRAIGLGLMPSVHRHPLVLKGSSPARFI